MTVGLRSFYRCPGVAGQDEASCRVRRSRAVLYSMAAITENWAEIEPARSGFATCLLVVIKGEESADSSWRERRPLGERRG